MKKRLLYSATLAALLPLSAPLWAVDEAELIEPRSCDLELEYTDVRRGGHSFFVEPTCRLDGNWQVGLGFGREVDDGERFNVYEVQTQWLFRDMDEHGFGLGLSVGAEYTTEENRWERTFARLPYSVELIPDRWVMHANLGVEHDRGEARRRAAIWGLGSEVAVTGPLALLFALSGDDRSENPAEMGVGPRLMLFDERLELNLTYSRQLTIPPGESRREESWSVGLGFTALRF